MLHPPEQFSKLRGLAWSAPVMALFGWGMALWAHGLRPGELVLGITGVIMAVLFLLAQQAIWVSPWGSRFQWVASLSAFFGMVVPWALMLPPLLHTDALPPASRSVVVVTALTLVLLVSAIVHGRRASIDLQAKALDWSGCRLDLRKHVIRGAVRLAPATSAQWAIAPSMLGGLSVVLYHFLRSWLPEQTMVLAASLFVFAATGWICAMPLGRALGQGWQLRRVEKQLGGRFASDQLPRLTRERQRSVIGRWWARRQPGDL